MDLIDRQAAIDVAKEEIDNGTFYDIPSKIEYLPSAQPTQSNTPNALTALDCISRQAAIDALWKALFSYEEKEEERFQKSEELDVGDWFLHRIFVQNMSDIDRQTIRDLPSAQPERKRGKWIVYKAPDKYHCGMVRCPFCGEDMIAEADEYNYCPHCGADMRGE